MTAQSFWDWSQEAYARPGAAAALLKLQDAFGLNVNILLWCCWCANARVAVTDLALRKAIDLLDGWTRDVTAPLRSVRRSLKTPPRQADAAGAEALREKTKALELDAEKLEQAMLENLARDLAPGGEASNLSRDARRALALYADLAGAARVKGFSTLLLDDLARALFAEAPLETASR